MYESYLQKGVAISFIVKGGTMIFLRSKSFEYQTE